MNHRKPRERSSWLGWWLLAPAGLLVALVVVLSLAATIEPGMTEGGAPIVSAAPVRTAVPSVPPDTSVPLGPDTAFSGDRAVEVGHDIEAGIYRTEGQAQGRSICRWQRLRDADPPSDRVIAQGESHGPVTVTVRPGDAVFQVTGCMPWRMIESP